MRMIQIRENEAGQSLYKFLAKYMNLAPKSFFYKMLRKKNITLNGKKAEGSELLITGDEIKLFLSEETIEKFTEVKQAVRVLIAPDIIYEDAHILIMNKPSGMLSQKAEADDISMVEVVISYLMEKGELSHEDLRSFRPSVCNRLDRNTSGILVAGKSLAGLQQMAKVFKDRSIDKYYECIVAGEVVESSKIEGYLTKDTKTNRVVITKTAMGEDSLPIRTQYTPIESTGKITRLRVKLITGRSHQIRAHLASIGHPILGDAKYGDKKINEYYRKQYKIKSQMLHSAELKMPVLDSPFSYLSEKIFTAPLPKEFEQVIKGEGIG